MQRQRDDAEIAFRHGGRDHGQDEKSPPAVREPDGEWHWKCESIRNGEPVNGWQCG